MRGPGGGVLRGAVLAGLSALLAAAGHAAAGGTLPDLAVLVPVLPLLAVIFTGTAARCRGLVGTVAVLAAGQFVLHNAIELMHPSHTGSSMLAMHAVATVVTALAMRHADRGAAALMAALGRVLPRRLVPPPADRPLRTLALPGPAVPARLARASAVAHARRGPPVAC